ncbi:P-loop ATPase, Sll1717 family [Clostridium beijerinckii]|uniref:KAP NTPase domain-containing protein n=1 Tax=Clostridium beijerinckii TaxID=1520 RepID=A0AAW3W9A0_CLOBE|nr:hypothetical protein [Clostridium beijerinckii]MBC2456115.1 hypothetical protein [Clostridium beijerinckii]MBC2475400.1 hypothetical protein [Clostridium beijerinckii]NOV58195.1 hypothetical protein [Clostridium beijerinckii]NOV69543.1 hypothetical protein [Clostridium beijerinckii]NOW31548.1 hypothetical protein [Clostridium beijerinckii]
MKLEEYQFGYADAAKEYTIIPEIFEKAFCDTRGIVDKLINKWDFMLVGRKGVGKSAFSAKIQSLSEKEDAGLFSYQMQLNDFEFSTFSKTNIDNDVLGTQKYKTSWEFILLLTIYKIIYNNLKINEVESFNNTVELLKSLGFPINIDYKRNISTLSKLKIGVNAGVFDVKFEQEFGIKPNSFLERISILNEKMVEVLSEVWFNNTRIIILIDGVDDILRFKKNQLDILSSLVRSVDYLNDKFIKNKLPIKIVLFIREDIICSVTDPDINKIKRDGSIVLSWCNRLEDLKSIVKLRFKLSGVEEENLETWWESIFPRRIRDVDSWTFMLEHTLYKPRDVLQFLKCCQENFPEKQSLTFSEINIALKSYSRDYFIEEMKNEITGFINDDLINILPSVFRKIATKSFDSAELKEIINNQSVKVYDDSDIKSLLLLLFESGYIGQIIKQTGMRRRQSVVFKYRNTTASIDYSQKFIIHKGLHRGLGVRI